MNDKKIIITPDDPADEKVAKQFEGLLNFASNELVAEFGTSENIRWGHGTLCYADGTKADLKCACGNEATALIMGKTQFIGLCNDCQFGPQEKSAAFTFRGDDESADK